MVSKKGYYDMINDHIVDSDLNYLESQNIKKDRAELKKNWLSKEELYKFEIYQLNIFSVFFSLKPCPSSITFMEILLLSKLDKLMMLQDEVKIAKKFIKDNGPEDMGYVHTSVNYMEERILDLRLQINKKLDA